MRIAIIGDGQMGLAMADAVATAGASTVVWGPFPDRIDRLTTDRGDAQRLPGFTIQPGIELTSEAKVAVAGADLIFNAVPTQFIRGTWTNLASEIPGGVPVICVAKGIETETLLLPSGIIESAAPTAGPVCALSGPTIARELVAHLPATMVAACVDGAVAKLVREVMDVPWLRIYTHDDVIGVEMAGAIKNVIALAAGILDGMGLGINTKSALLARGLAEIARLGDAAGARTETFFGIAGVGDLATTCFSPHSRNRTCGERLGSGMSLQEIESIDGMVIEGVATTKAAAELARRLDVEMPITDAVYAVLFDGLQPTEAIEGLMRRRWTTEGIS
jgi:glycerol-3-phosphate dehydrogenase (NAD(P)+)